MTSELPDFDDMMSVVDSIQELGMEKAVLEMKLAIREAEIVKEVTFNPKYHINGKVPSMAFIDKTYKYTGLENELLPMRQRLAEIEISLKAYNQTLNIYKSMIDVWRSKQANIRQATSL